MSNIDITMAFLTNCKLFLSLFLFVILVLVLAELFHSFSASSSKNDWKLTEILDLILLQCINN